MKLCLSLALFGSLPILALSAPSRLHAPAATHCQVPCGVYGDKLRIDMLMEDCATIEKAMTALIQMEGEEHPSHNQMVRWIMTKDQHSQSIQDQVARYWLAQRIKAPEDASEADARERYLHQLELLHGLTISAMKCKQTTDPAHVQALREGALALCATYFSAGDLEHIREHHAGEGAR